MYVRGGLGYRGPFFDSRQEACVAQRPLKSFKIHRMPLLLACVCHAMAVVGARQPLYIA